jgi:hypothetical protein
MTKIKIKYKEHTINIETENDPVLPTIVENIKKIIENLKK